MKGRYVVSLLSYRILGAVCSIFFAGCSVGAFLAQQYGPISIFGFFVLVGIYLLAAAGPYELTEGRIAQNSLFGQFEIRWQDVREVELGSQGTLVLRGRDKRFIVSPVSAWSGPDKAKAAELLCAKLDRPEIRSYSSASADFKTHRNVRV
ncbi:hypothetical protein [Pseudoxanthomonas wuyuanensis]|uniref:hypothetical protein n=1 Tax=Pseudoxanthomonas wuyuanensis TaxID=1073196 RepID=UPI000BE3FD38|nr:hypothetical protein [Pseudoxanthomonas wuyuanensis]KAF1721696.1 hypothetical protein CSC75_05635 [Pseudoxanthomonas wuyuanensis]